MFAKYMIATSSIVFLMVPAQAETVSWSGTLEFKRFDCAVSKVTEIIVADAVTLVHPEDKDPFKAPKEIGIDCNNLTFRDGGSLETISSLDIRINEVTSGPVQIINRRGVKGDDAAPTPDIWAVRKRANGSNGAHGGNGRDSSGCITGDHGSDPGGRGADGGAGEPGANYVAPKGANGRQGGSAADILLISRAFAEGTTIDIRAIGGDGGAGGRGGRGADGGDGGRGGNGGKGGDANRCHSSSGGGDGGRGGDGGDGGNGGPGGDGGNGGNGGTVTIGAQQGGILPTPAIKNGPGIGGFPGLGGERGEGGLGAPGGDGGSGGRGKNGLLGSIDRKPRSQGGNGGDRGTDGRPGKEGPMGVPGKDGQPGEIRKGQWGLFPQDVIDNILNQGS